MHYNEQNQLGPLMFNSRDCYSIGINGFNDVFCSRISIDQIGILFRHKIFDSGLISIGHTAKYFFQTNSSKLILPKFQSGEAAPVITS